MGNVHKWLNHYRHQSGDMSTALGGETSDVITVTDPESGVATYYIIQVTERDPNRPLNADLRHRLLQERFDTWLNEQRTNATILYLLDEEY